MAGHLGFRDRRQTTERLRKHARMFGIAQQQPCAVSPTERIAGTHPFGLTTDVVDGGGWHQRQIVDPRPPILHADEVGYHAARCVILGIEIEAATGGANATQDTALDEVIKEVDELGAYCFAHACCLPSPASTEAFGESIWVVWQTCCVHRRLASGIARLGHTALTGASAVLRAKIILRRIKR